MTLSYRKLILVVLAVLTAIGGQTAFASLAICIYHDQRIYIASDSLVHGIGEKDFKAPKIFPIGNTTWVSITGYYGSTVRDRKTGQAVSRIFFPIELGRICKEANASKQLVTLEDKINSINQRFALIYSEGLDTLLSTKVDPRTIEATRLYFVGYDPSTKSFFGKSYLYQGKGRPTIETRFVRNADNNEPDISFQGESHFLSRLLTSSDSAFTTLRSENLNKTFSQLLMPDSIVTDQDVKNFILELFNLHKLHAASVGPDKGLIGEPYHIYKIMSDKTMKIH